MSNNNLASSFSADPLLDSLSKSNSIATSISTDSLSVVGSIATNTTSTATYTYPYDNSINGYYSGSIRISDDYMEKELIQKKVEEILESVQDYCKNFCFQGCEGICDGETKSQCPLWNRLKCEKKV